MKSLSFSVIIYFCYLIVSLPGESAYPDIVWTKLFNYSGKIIEEGPDYVIIKMADAVKKIPRTKIEDITYSQKTQLPPEKRETIQKAGKSLEKVVQEQIKWRKEHPKEYARQLKEEEDAIKKEEAQEDARLKNLLEEEKKEDDRLRRLLEVDMRMEEEARKEELKSENQDESQIGGEEVEKPDDQGRAIENPVPANPLPDPDQFPAAE